VPLAKHKTIEPTEVLTFLGVEFDTRDMILRLPGGKLEEVKSRLQNAMKANKVTLCDLKSPIGLLNFACLAIAPGRTFIRRLIDATCNVNKPHHKIRATGAIKEDLKVWITFLTDYNGVTVMLDNLWTSNETVEFYTDSAGGSTRGFGIYFQGKWAHACWPKDWVDNQLLAEITFLEMFPIVIAINIWGASLKNKKI
jgi:hypothetical protein